MQVCILSGGSGTRLWPASREAHPKQFLALFGDESLLVQTVRRAESAGANQIAVLTNETMAEPTRRHLREANVVANLLTEPAQRNTGPAIAYAAARLGAENDEPVVFLPADHYIPDKEVFAEVLQDGAKVAAEQDVLVVMGKPPERPETGYGYIERGDPFYGPAFHVNRFVEKPDLATAIKYLESDVYWWNTGMVISKPSVILRELQEHRPDMAVAVTEAVGSPTRYADAPNESFDYAVLEKSEQVVMLEARFRWSDVGSWIGWSDLAPVDEDHNAYLANATVITDNARSNIVWSKRTVALQGVKDLIVVDGDETLLITTKDEAQRIKDIRKKAGGVDSGLL